MMRMRFFLIVTCLGLALPSFAQSATPIAYPQKGQSDQQTAKDKGECDTWAKQQQTQPAAHEESGPSGARVRGAARGAAAGAAIGAAAGDAGKGAAIGATSGAVVGGRRQRKAQQQQQQQAEAAQQDSYNRAFAACMEGRGYSVK
jgi:hypothetical protein